MSIKLMAQAWEVEGLTNTERLLLLALADFANDEGYCWPSRETLMQKALHRESKSSISRFLSGLERKGIIERATYMKSDGRQGTNDYMLTGLLPQADRGRTMRPLDEDRGRTTATEGSHHGNRGVAPRQLEGSHSATQIRQRDPSTDPSENHQPVCTPSQRPPRTPAFTEAHNRFGHMNSAYLRYLRLGSTHRQTREQAALVLTDRGEGCCE